MKRLTAYQRASIYLSIHPSIEYAMHTDIAVFSSLNKAYMCMRTDALTYSMVWVRRLPFVLCLCAVHYAFLSYIHTQTLFLLYNSHDIQGMPAFKKCFEQRKSQQQHKQWRQRIKMNYTMKRIELPQLRVASFATQFFMVERSSQYLSLPLYHLVIQTISLATLLCLSSSLNLNN